MLTPTETLDTINKASVKKATSSTSRLLILGFLAGLMIAFAALFSTIASMNLLEDPSTFGLAKLIQGFTFSGGLIMVVLTGSELFTGNSLMVIGILDDKITWRQLLRNWSLVFVGNFLGASLLALLCYVAGTYSMNGGLVGSTLASISSAKCALTPEKGIILGLLCNILVCLAVYMAFSAKSLPGKLLSCIFPVMFFVACGFEHSIANLFYIPAGFLASGTVDILGFLSNIFFVVIGNILGGSIFVACSFYIANSQKTS